MILNRELVQAIRVCLRKDPAVTVSQLAKEFKIPETFILMSFPVQKRMRVRVESLEALLETIQKNYGLALDLLYKNKSLQKGNELLFDKRIDSDEFLIESSRIETPQTDWRKVQEKTRFIWLVSRLQGIEKGYSIRFFDEQGDEIVSGYLTESINGRLSLLAGSCYGELCRLYGIVPKPWRPCSACKRHDLGKIQENHIVA